MGTGTGWSQANGIRDVRSFCSMTGRKGWFIPAVDSLTACQLIHQLLHTRLQPT